MRREKDAESWFHQEVRNEAVETRSRDERNLGVKPALVLASGRSTPPAGSSVSIFSSRNLLFCR
jgi:hypothetical protein